MTQTGFHRFERNSVGGGEGLEEAVFQLASLASVHYLNMESLCSSTSTSNPQRKNNGIEMFKRL